MIIHLPEIETKIYTVEKYVKRRVHAKAMMEAIGFQNWSFVFGSGDYGLGVLRNYRQMLESCTAPCLILEDDAVPRYDNYRPVIDVPNDAEIIYLGAENVTSENGKAAAEEYCRQQGESPMYARGNPGMVYRDAGLYWIRLLSSLASHAILYLSTEAMRKLADAMTNEELVHNDRVLAVELHKHYAYAPRSPIFYQLRSTPENSTFEYLGSDAMPEANCRTKRKHLLFISARGGQSCLTCDGDDRTFDVAINNFSGKPGWRHMWAEYSFAADLEKFEGASALLGKTMLDYESVAFFDEDVEVSVGTMNRLFAAGVERKLKLWQGAFTADSAVSHPHLITRPASEARTAKFIELACPFFSRDGLRECLPTFQYTHSAWGLQDLWARILGPPTILDTIQVRHMRPPRGPRMMKNGKTAFEEEEELRRRHRL